MLPANENSTVLYREKQRFFGSWFSFVVCGVSILLVWIFINGMIEQLYYGRSARHENALVLGFNNIAHLEAAGDRALITFR